MAAVVSAPQLALDAVLTASRPSATIQSSSYSATNAETTQPPSHPSLRLPSQPEIDRRRNPLKRKWRSIVNFFALPIRAYYLEPPGLAYRAELRARRGQGWDQADDQHTFWPVPAYTDQVGDDEMVLFKAQEEAHVLAALQRDQAVSAAVELEQQIQHQESPEFNDEYTDDDDDDEEPSAPAATWPQTPPEHSILSAFQTSFAEPSPRYEIHDPLATFASQPITPPSFTNGTAMSRHLSTPLSPTVPSAPPTSSSGTFLRRNRAQSNAARPSLAGRNISEPLSWTLVRSQYSYPKRGPTAQQLTFLNSVESLGRFGVPHSPSGGLVAPSPAYESSSAGDYGFPAVHARS